MVGEMVLKACEEAFEAGKEEGAKQRKKSGVLPEAEQVYALFPKKVGKDDALKSISAALKKHPLAFILDKTNQFAEAVNSWPTSYRYGKDGRDFCPHPATWFNDGRYQDDAKEWKRFGARNPAPNQHVSPPEPEGWREAFPDFTDKDKPWKNLQPSQQQYITTAMALAACATSIPQQVEQEQILRNA